MSCIQRQTNGKVDGSETLKVCQERIDNHEELAPEPEDKFVIPRWPYFAAESQEFLQIRLIQTVRVTVRMATGNEEPFNPCKTGNAAAVAHQLTCGSGLVEPSFSRETEHHHVCI